MLIIAFFFLLFWVGGRLVSLWFNFTNNQVRHPNLFAQGHSAKMSRKGLMEQDLKKLDVTKLHPLSPEVISRQATINIGNFSFVYDSFIAHIIPDYTVYWKIIVVEILFYYYS